MRLIRILSTAESVEAASEPWLGCEPRMRGLWRISRHLDLSGAGGLRAPGPWHHAGQPIVYLAATPAAALLEVCVHTAASDVPPNFTLLKIAGSVTRVPNVELRDLPNDWRMRLKTTRDFGTAWLRRKDTVLLQAQSTLAPETVNFLFNPVHAAAARFRIEEVFVYPFDLRLKK
jgi:RES domain-containing protein